MDIAPDRDTAKSIPWLTWHPAAFDRAQQADQPILLAISAVWCYWCQVMEQTTYVDPAVVDFITDNFVPVRVDNDHRPEVNARYNVGGWPTTALLTPHGGSIAGATYLPPDQLLAMLSEVRRAYAEDKPGLYDQAAQLQRQRQEYVHRAAAGPELTHRQVDRIARRIAGVYDARHGGFGEAPKFPAAPVLQFLLHCYRTTGEKFYRAMLTKTLDAMLDGELYDGVDGGFFRYCAQADWSEAQHEKLLEDNIGLARVFLDAALLLDNPQYRQAAVKTIDYLLTTLYCEKAGGFRGSQGAHSDYFAQPPQVRQVQEPPPVDAYCYAAASLQAVSLLLAAAWKLPRPELTKPALQVLDNLAGQAAAGRLPHAFDPAGQPSPQLPESGDLLLDWAALLNALMDAYHCCPQRPDYLPQAVAAASELENRFADRSRGAFFDTEPDPAAAGSLRIREKPLPENVAAALGLLKLHHATGDSQYQQRAESVLSAFVDANRDYGEHAAGYAVAVDRFLHPPLEITLEGNPDAADYPAMAQAAARIDYPNIIIKPNLTPGGDGPVQAHICLAAVCFPPVSQPSELPESVAEALAGSPSPIENIFERFAGF